MNLCKTSSKPWQGRLFSLNENTALSVVVLSPNPKAGIYRYKNGNKHTIKKERQIKKK